MEIKNFVCPECGCRVFSLVEERKYYAYFSKGILHRSLKETNYRVKCNNPKCNGVYRRELLESLDKMSSGFTNIIEK